MRLGSRGLWIIALSTAVGWSAVWAQTPPAPVASSPIRDETLFEFEREKARRYGAASNPAVLRMTRAQYLQAIEKLHPAFRPTPEERRAAQLYGTWRRKADWDDVADRWRRRASVRAWGVPWEELRVLPWAPVVDLTQRGWAKGEVAPASPDFLPDHYLVASVDFRGVLRQGVRRPFPATEALRFSLTVDDKPAFAQAGETREGRFATKTFVFFEPVDDDDDRDRSRGNRRRRPPESVAREGLTYHQDYRIVFDLLHADGAPRVGPEAKTVRLTLREGSNEATVTFDLRDWQPLAVRTMP